MSQVPLSRLIVMWLFVFLCEASSKSTKKLPCVVHSRLFNGTGFLCAYGPMLPIIL